VALEKHWETILLAETRGGFIWGGVCLFVCFFFFSRCFLVFAKIKYKFLQARNMIDKTMCEVL
jgi:hypothetical protein